MTDPTALFQQFLTILDRHGSWQRLMDAHPHSMTPVFVQENISVHTTFDLQAAIPLLTRLQIGALKSPPVLDLLDNPLTCSPLDLYRPQRILERIQRGIGARGRFAWERLEQILTGCILTQHPTAIGTWDVGLHPDVQSASGPTYESPLSVQFSPIYRPLFIESLPFDLPRLLREFHQTIGPVRLLRPTGIDTPLSLSIDIPHDFEERLQALDAVHETAHCPDLFVIQD